MFKVEICLTGTRITTKRSVASARLIASLSRRCQFLSKCGRGLSVAAGSPALLSAEPGGGGGRPSTHMVMIHNQLYSHFILVLPLVGQRVIHQTHAEVTRNDGSMPLTPLLRSNKDGMWCRTKGNDGLYTETLTGSFKSQML